MLCTNCQTGHLPIECANNDAPMINRTCNCRCTRAESDPAPYWTQKQRAISEGTRDDQ